MHLNGRRQLYSVLVWLCISVCPLLANRVPEAAEPLPEYSVKALFLYNFLKFTEWPEGPRKEFGVCVLGSDPFGDALDAIEGKTAHGLPVRVRRDMTAERAKECALVFINEPDRPRLLRTLRLLEGFSVLTVAEHEGFVNSGGMIGLEIRDSRVQFQINVRATGKGNLKISAQLLKLARQVVE